MCKRFEVILVVRKFGDDAQILCLVLCIIAVAPHAGAWIEIEKYVTFTASAQVAPHAGAWIEISF